MMCDRVVFFLKKLLRESCGMREKVKEVQVMKDIDMPNNGLLI